MTVMKYVFFVAVAVAYFALVSTGFAGQYSDDELVSEYCVDYCDSCMMELEQYQCGRDMLEGVIADCE